MEITPRNDKLVVQRLEVEHKVGSIMLSGKPAPSNKGIVLAVGSKCDPAIKVGMTIVFDERANEEFDGKLMLANKDVYGIMQ